MWQRLLRIKSSRMSWAGHVARMGKKWNAHRVVVGKLKDRDRLEDNDMDGKVILNWIWKKEDNGVDWVDLCHNKNKLLALWKKVTNSPFLRNMRNILSSWGTVTFSSRNVLSAVSCWLSAHLASSRCWLVSLRQSCDRDPQLLAGHNLPNTIPDHLFLSVSLSSMLLFPSTLKSSKLSLSLILFINTYVYFQSRNACYICRSSCWLSAEHYKSWSSYCTVFCPQCPSLFLTLVGESKFYTHTAQEVQLHFVQSILILIVYAVEKYGKVNSECNEFFCCDTVVTCYSNGVTLYFN
jgi:hypothetical protein